MPKELQGTWCPSPVHPKGTDVYARVTASKKAAEDDDMVCPFGDSEWIVATENGWRTSEDGCSGIRSITTRGVGSRQGYHIVFKGCGGEGYTWDESWDTYLGSNGQMYVKTVQKDNKSE
jgi:hypothetical protein